MKSDASRLRIQLRQKSNAIRIPMASRRPTRQALLRRSSGNLPVSTEMKTMLSMPSTNSSPVRVNSATQASAEFIHENQSIRKLP